LDAEMKSAKALIWFCIVIYLTMAALPYSGAGKILPIKLFDAVSWIISIIHEKCRHSQGSAMASSTIVAGLPACSVGERSFASSKRCFPGSALVFVPIAYSRGKIATVAAGGCAAKQRTTFMAAASAVGEIVITAGAAGLRPRGWSVL
jgi:hypothetical protein